MNLLNLLDAHNIYEYDSVKLLLENEPFNLIVKEDPHYPNLYMVHYDKRSNFNNAIVNECNGIILEKNTNRIVCYAFDKLLEFNNISLPEHFDWQSIKVERAIDGTLIKMYHYDGEWRYATSHCIDAKRAYWFTQDSFYDLFTDVQHMINYNSLNENYCYSFVLCHPKNRIVVKYDYPKLYHVLTRDLNTLNEIDVDIGIEKPELITSFDSFEELLNDATNSDSMEEGYMLFDKNRDRMKIKSGNYNKIKELRGNTNNLFYNFLQLRFDNIVQQYLTFYPEYSEQFALFELDVRKLASEIHRQYVNKHVRHLESEIPVHLKTMVYKLHSSYIETRVITTVAKILDELAILQPSQVCYMYNQTFGYHTV